MSIDPDAEIASLREQIRRLDRDLVELTARRLQLAKRVGELKQGVGQPIRNYVVEAEALRVVRETAAELGVRPAMAEELLKLEILESLRAQERDRVTRGRPAGAAGRALVVGGAGNMGRWFVEFLESKGYQCSVADPRGAPPGRPLVVDVAASASGFDLVLLATPPSATPDIVRALPAGPALVLDIASLKAPIARELREAAARGVRVASIHPMWGPGADLLADRNVIVCDCGDAEAARAARKLFEDTAANLVELGLEEHDRAMGIVLGLPHAVSLVFGSALAAQAGRFDEFAHLGGPTFQKQVRVSAEVAAENKDLYFEIQRLNPHTGEVLAALRRSLDELESAVRDREMFRAYMAKAQSFFAPAAPQGGGERE